MPTWRTITAFFLLVLLAVPLLVLSVLQLRQVYIQQRMEARLEAGMLKTIFIPLHKFQQLNSHEILVDNKLFDVKTLQVTSNGYLATGVFDEEETTVLQQIDKSGGAHTSKDTPVYAQAFQLLQDFYFQHDGEPCLAFKLKTELFQNPIPQLPLYYRQVVSPPPQAHA